MEQFKTWDKVRQELYTPEEIIESDMRVILIGEMIKARKEKGISQRELEKMSGVKQPIIARMESGAAKPQIETLNKIYHALGKTIAVIDL